jgi:hypothetical protein
MEILSFLKISMQINENHVYGYKVTKIAFFLRTLIRTMRKLKIRRTKVVTNDMKQLSGVGQIRFSI